MSRGYTQRAEPPLEGVAATGGYNMPKSSNQKLKLIYLMKILLERTDETHSITMPEIIDALAAYDISAECKTGKNREPSMLSTVPDVLPTNFEICSLLGLIYCLRLMRV